MGIASTMPVCSEQGYCLNTARRCQNCADRSGLDQA